MKGKKEYCIGCRQSYYNGNNDVGIWEDEDVNDIDHPEEE